MLYIHTLQPLHCPMALTLLPNFNFRGRASACSILLMGQMFRLFYIIVVFSIIITLPRQICNALEVPACNIDNYIQGSMFERNLNTVLNSLVQHTSQTGFNTSEYGQGSERIYGLLQCRGDTTVDQCYICSQQANTTLLQNCGNAIGGRIWLDACYIRYENYSFFGEVDILMYYDVPNGSNLSRSDLFQAAVGGLISTLIAEATSSSKLYASGTTVDPSSRKIYALVQCWRDISNSNCTTCLSTKISSIYLIDDGRQGGRDLMGSCIIRYERYAFFNSTALPPSPAPNKLPLILGVAGGVLILVLLALFATRRRLKSAIFRRPSEGDGKTEEDYSETLKFQDRQIVLFKMETLLAATANFLDCNKLGEGGFGPVYKGTTHDGKEIAVKRLSVNSMQGKREFLNEVELVAKIQHRNLVKLLGCCADGSETLLVYEYLPNQSLDKILFDPNKRKLNWQRRYNIILGIARGLLYLHQDSQPRIIHRDIKASNILLDEKMNPKIADFGLAKLFPEDESHVSTRVAGTFGYMAPEYAMQGQLTVKADVYSFGILLLEIISGRKNTDCNLSHEMQILLGWAWKSYEGGNIVQMIDPSIIDTCDEGKALRCIHVGLLCTQADSSLRPPMSTVTLMLSTDSMNLPDPTKPIFVITQITEATSSASGSSHASATIVALPSHAYVSITALVPR